MKLWNRAPALILFCSLGAWLAHSGARRGSHGDESRTRAELQFTRCHDGDTCTAKTSEGISLTLRLLGMDAPEVLTHWGRKKTTPGQPYGEEAAARMRELVVGKTLPVELRGHDIYRRYLAIIYDAAGSTRLNERMVREGYAFAYRGKARTDADVREWSEAAEAEAKKAKVGLWGLPDGQRPEAPWDFRSRLKK